MHLWKHCKQKKPETNVSKDMNVNYFLETCVHNKFLVTFIGNKKNDTKYFATIQCI